MSRIVGLVLALGAAAAIPWCWYAGSPSAVCLCAWWLLLCGAGELPHARWAAWLRLVFGLPVLLPLVSALFLWRLFDWHTFRTGWGPEGGDLLQRPIEWLHAIAPGHRWGPEPGRASDDALYDPCAMEWCPGCHGWRRAP